MENYRIYFTGSEKEEVIRVLRNYNEVLIDNVDENSVGITIERDDDGAFYRRLMEEIDREVYALRNDAGI